MAVSGAEAETAEALEAAAPGSAAVAVPEAEAAVVPAAEVEAAEAPEAVPIKEGRQVRQEAVLFRLM